MNRIFKIFYADLKVNLSYFSSFLSQFALVFVQVLMFFYISRYVEIESIYNGNIEESYFLYVVMAICLIDILNTIINSIPRQTLNYKTNGIFEELFSFKGNDYLIFIGSSIYPVFLSVIKIIIYLSFSMYLAGSSIVEVQYFSEFFLTIILTMSAFCFIGILSSAYTILFFKSNFIPIIYLGISIFFGSAYFPSELINANFLFLSHVTIFDESMEIIRMLRDDNFNAEIFYSNISEIIILNLIYFLASFVSIKLALNHAKKNGTLLFY